MNKTIQEWLGELPNGYRELALANYTGTPHYPGKPSDLAHAVIKAFEWRYTPEGTTFWGDVSDALDDPNKDFPPLPGPKFAMGDVWEREGKTFHVTQVGRVVSITHHDAKLSADCFAATSPYALECTKVWSC